MDCTDRKRQRCSSYSSEEKMLIANICAKYKHILENKKTDHVTSEEKKMTWERISLEVNSAALNCTYRSSETLKRFYENRKREVRKIAAEEKTEIFSTGGGPSTSFKKDPCHDVILSVMNSKTVYGLENDFDGDAEPYTVLTEPSSLNTDGSPQPKCDQNAIEIIYESAGSTKNENQETTIWKKYCPADLKKPITPNLANFDDTTKLLGSKRQDNQEQNLKTPESRKNKELPTSRRSPTSEMKTLTRSDVAEKYNKLLDERLAITNYQEKKLEEELLTIEGERRLKFQLLELQIEVEKEKLKQLRKSTIN